MDVPTQKAIDRALLVILDHPEDESTPIIRNILLKVYELGFKDGQIKALRDSITDNLIS